MDETEFRILDTLASDLGSPFTILGLTERIRQRHKTAYYKNIYEKIQELKAIGIIRLEKAGKSLLVSLDFASQKTTPLLGDMERKKKESLEKNAELQMLFLEMNTYFRQGFSYLTSISIINPLKTIPLNRAEFLFILGEPSEQREGILLERKIDPEPLIKAEKANIHLLMDSLQKMHPLKLDFLVLREGELLDLLKEDQLNPVKGMLSGQVAFFHPEDYWIAVKTVLKGGMTPREVGEVHPGRLSESDLAYNMRRFGYKEMGSSDMKNGRNICLEYIITSILITGEARRMQAIPLMLVHAEKSALLGLGKRKPNYSLLVFLSMKYRTLGKLLGILQAMEKAVPSQEREGMVQLLERIGTAEERISEKAIREKMRLYHAESE